MLAGYSFTEDFHADVPLGTFENSETSKKISTAVFVAFLHTFISIYVRFLNNKLKNINNNKN